MGVGASSTHPPPPHYDHGRGHHANGSMGYRERDSVNAEMNAANREAAGTGEANLLTLYSLTF